MNNTDSITAADLSKGTVSIRRTNIRMDQHALLVWLDSNIDFNGTDGQSAMVELQRVSDNIRTFRDRDQCIDFLTDTHNGEACLIISGPLSQNIIPLIHNVAQIQNIFIFCRKKNKLEQWAADWPKIKGVFTDIAPICKALRRAAYQSEQNVIPISIVGIDEDISSKSLDQLNSSYMYTQIIKEILSTITFEEKHRKVFFDYSRVELIDNEATLENVNKLEQGYHDQTPIWWYTSEHLFSSVLNRALRTMEMSIIIKMGFFINDLQRQIQQLHIKQFTGHHTSDSFTVYRRQAMSQIDFTQLMKTKGGFMSFNNFLSTSKKLEVSLLFAESSLSDSNQMGILFVIAIDPSKSTTAFASVTGVAYHGDVEDEILFSMHTVFRICDIKPMGDTRRLFHVELTLTTDDDRNLRVLTNHIRKETFSDSPGWFRLGAVLVKIGQVTKAQQVYEAMLEQATEDREKAHIYHTIGYAKDQQREYKEAIVYYEKSLEINRKTLSSNHPHSAISYNNIGGVYAKMGEYSKALSYYEKSLTIRQQSLPLNHPDLAFSFNNIGNVYYKMGEYAIALSSYENALAVRCKSLPPNHPDFGTSFNNMGAVYDNMGEHSRALTCYKKALAIRQHSLPPNHPDLAGSYNNIGTTYYNMEEYLDALSYYEKALAVQQQSLPPNHPDFAGSYNNIGNVYDNMSEYSTALSSYKKALAIRQRSLPPNHPQLASSYNNIGTTYESMGNYLKAHSCLERAVDIGQHSLPSNNSHLQIYRMNFDRIKKKL